MLDHFNKIIIDAYEASFPVKLTTKSRGILRKKREASNLSLASLSERRWDVYQNGEDGVHLIHNTHLLTFYPIVEGNITLFDTALLERGKQERSRPGG